LTGTFQFLGVSVGMNIERAFERLEENAGKATWTAFSSNVHPRKYATLKVGLESTDWPTLANADTWMLRDFGVPCAGQRYSFVYITHDRISSIEIRCDAIKQ
jgi:hypothetical protein